MNSDSRSMVSIRKVLVFHFQILSKDLYPFKMKKSLPTSHLQGLILSKSLSISLSSRFRLQLRIEETVRMKYKTITCKSHEDS